MSGKLLEETSNRNRWWETNVICILQRSGGGWRQTPGISWWSNLILVGFPRRHLFFKLAYYWSFNRITLALVWDTSYYQRTLINWNRNFISSAQVNRIFDKEKFQPGINHCRFVRSKLLAFRTSVGIQKSKMWGRWDNLILEIPILLYQTFPPPYQPWGKIYLEGSHKNFVRSLDHPFGAMDVEIPEAVMWSHKDGL